MSPELDGGPPSSRLQGADANTEHDTGGRIVCEHNSAQALPDLVSFLSLVHRSLLAAFAFLAQALLAPVCSFRASTQAVDAFQNGGRPFSKAY